MTPVNVLRPEMCLHGCNRRTVFDQHRDLWVHLPWRVSALEVPYWHHASPWVPAREAKP